MKLVSALVTRSLALGLVVQFWIVAGSALAQPVRAVQGAAGGDPFAAVVSLDRTSTYLDKVAGGWIRERRCGACHTTYPYLPVRARLGADSEAYREIRLFFEDRVAHWDDPRPETRPRWDAEVIATAEALARSDEVAGILHPLTRKALDRMWTLQQPDGGFTWLKCGWPPLECDDYYGALVVALAVGHAPGDYARTLQARQGMERLRGFLKHNKAPSLHHEVVLLMASARLEGLMTKPERDRVLVRLRELERPGGGWALPSLGAWKRRDGSANDPGVAADGYATGLVVLTLRETGVAASEPMVARGLAWLLSHQRASGAWFTRSLNNDKQHYIARAGTAYAVLALQACGLVPQPSRPVVSGQPAEAGPVRVSAR